jgi:cell division protein FtsZ
VKTVLKDAGTSMMGIGYASGEGRAEAAARAAINSPLLESSIEGARGILLLIAGGNDLGLFEFSQASDIIQAVAHPDANIILGSVIDDSLGDEMRVTVVAAGFERGMPRTGARGREEEPLFGRRDTGRFGPDDDDDFGDDDFDVPSFLK